MVPVEQHFGREHRLRRRRDIDRAFREGKRWEGELFSLRVLKKEDPTPRLLVVAGRRLGTAVARNRVRRAIREGFRKHKGLFSHRDVVVLPRPKAAMLSPGELARKFLEEFQEVNHGQGDTAHQGGL